MTATLARPAQAPAGRAPLRLRVAELHAVATDIRSVVLVAADGSPLPGYPPGSHLVLACGERRNAYSLTGDGVSPDSYPISVLRCPDGNGGSRWIHELAVGDEVEAEPPRSAFPPVTTARRHLLVAGGIGITPMLSHARAAVRWRREFTLLYGHRPGAGAHLRELRELCGPRLEEHRSAAAFRPGIEAALTTAPLGTHLYACGPAALLDFVVERAAQLGWPEDRVHTERFSAAALDPGEPFEVALSRSGRRVAVPSGVSLLDALERAGVTVPNLCRQGVCGECRVPVRAGRPLHRDLFLTPEEKAAADSVMCCVSRSTGPSLELDL
ncbi:PDR/VanB family oxidoreductase [Modestobacter sp. SYSU DS0657]